MTTTFAHSKVSIVSMPCLFRTLMKCALQLGQVTSSFSVSTSEKNQTKHDLQMYFFIFSFLLTKIQQNNI